MKLYDFRVVFSYHLLMLPLLILFHTTATAADDSSFSRPSKPAPQKRSPAAVLPRQLLLTFYSEPFFQNYRLNYCLERGGTCGKTVADRWCRLKGYRKAEDFKIAANLGPEIVTFYMGDETLCEQSSCDGFAFITCEP